MTSEERRQAEAGDELRERFLAQLDSLNLSPEDLAKMPPDEKALVEEIIAEQQKLVTLYQSKGSDTYEPQAHQLPFHASAATNRWFIGGNKMGKTRALNQEIKWYALDCHPYRNIGRRGPIWVCCPSDEKSESYQQPQLERVIGPEHIARKFKSPRPKWLLTNGQWIYFKNYSQDVATFSSDEIRLIAFDEEPPYDIWEEAWMRRSADFDLDLIGTCTPTNGLTWIHSRIVDPQSDELLPDTEWFGGSMFDNQYISEEIKKRTAAGLSGVMYRIRVLGDILPIGGSMVFDPDVLLKWRRAARPPVLRMNLKKSGRWVQEPDGLLWLWRLPERDHEYILGDDPAEGLNTSASDAEPDHDQTAISIYDRHRRQYVGEYVSGSIRPDENGEWLLPALSTWYNRARVIVERNNHGHTVIALARKKIPDRLYRPPSDRTDAKRHPDEGYGHLTTKPSRSFMIDLLKQAIASESVTDYSAPGIRQLTSFVLKSNGRMEHQDGSKDDRVFARALCLVQDHDLRQPIKIPDRSEKAFLHRLAVHSQDRTGTGWYHRIAGRR